MFSKTNKIAREKSYDCVLTIHVKKYEIAYGNYPKQSARIKYKNNLFKPCK